MYIKIEQNQRSLRIDYCLLRLNITIPYCVAIFSTKNIQAANLIVLHRLKS